jgi:pyrroloquinoline quinone (PQQ) biosynthesis protein C
LLGYIYFLEAFAAQVVPETTKKLEALYGRKCTTFLRLHAEEDQDHVEKAFTFIASLSLDRQKEICINHAQSMQAFNQMIKSVVHAAAKNNQKAG